MTVKINSARWCFCVTLIWLDVGSVSCIKSQLTLSECDKRIPSVNCTGRNFKQLPVADDSTDAHHVLYMYFDKNAITEVKSGHFEKYVNMSYLMLRENQIGTVEPHSFDANLGLMHIDLAHNNLSYLPPDLFRKLEFLQYVYLDNNKLKRIESEMFNHMTNLEDVRLQKNQLEYVGKDCFVQSHKLHSLYLESNNLQIPEKQSHNMHVAIRPRVRTVQIMDIGNWFLLFKPDSTSEAYLDDNPWSCDCRMKEFHKWCTKHPWFLEHDRRGVSVPKCHYPQRLKGISLAKISSTSELVCENVAITSQDSSLFVIKTVEGKPATLSCNATGLPIPIANISNPNDEEIVSSKGSVTFHIEATKTTHSGLYYCTASGFDTKGLPLIQTVRIRLTVYTSAGHVAIIILVSLLVIATLLLGATWYYKKKIGKQSEYSSLSSKTVYYDTSEESQRAANNVESMHSAPFFTSPPTNVSNPYQNETEDDEEEDVQFSKDTEVLV